MAEKLAREVEAQELLKQEEAARRRATQTERALRASSIGRKFHHRTLRMRDATGYQIYIGFDYERRESVPIQGFDLPIGRLYGIRAYLGDEGWKARIQAPAGVVEETYATDEEFQAVMEPLLEKLVAAALEALLRGKEPTGARVEHVATESA
jgi:hypothetical protein